MRILFQVFIMKQIWEQWEILWDTSESYETLMRIWHDWEFWYTFEINDFMRDLRIMRYTWELWNFNENFDTIWIFWHTQLRTMSQY